MAKRKTFDVDQFRRMVNDRLSYVSDVKVQATLCSILESVLQETGNYKGFRFTHDPDNTVDSTSPYYFDRHYF